MKFSHFAMGTTFELFIAAQEESYARQAADAVFSEIDHLEGILSHFDPCSDVGRLSRLSPGQSLRVGIELLECLQIAAQVYAGTNGAFDVTAAALLKNPQENGLKAGWSVSGSSSGFSRFYFAENGAVFFETRPVDRNRKPLRRRALCQVRHRKKPQAVEKKGPDLQQPLCGDPLTITILTDADATAAGGCFLNLDFGGIGKGYALDKILAILRDWDITRALINAGTSTVLAIGDSPENGPGEKGWPVGTAGDRICLQNMALSGSGKEVKGEHIVDPHTGKPACGHRSAWAACSSAALADALSTAFIVMGPEEVKEFCSAHPEVWGRVIEPSGSFKVYNQ